jgi:hypothetical protein
MNERIKELKIQAGKWANENASSAEYENACDAKFAELIVRECIRQIEKQGNGLTSTTEWDEGYRAGLNASQKATKRYFGVEK